MRFRPAVRVQEWTTHSDLADVNMGGGPAEGSDALDRHACLALKGMEEEIYMSISLGGPTTYTTVAASE